MTSPERKPRFAGNRLHDHNFGSPSTALPYFEPVETPESASKRWLRRIMSKNSLFRRFAPEIPGDDRFGNRIFRRSVTKETGGKSYTERESDREIQAALLVSREGREFLQENPGLLTDLDSALINITQDPNLTQVDLKRGGELTKLIEGEEASNSNVYILKTKKGKKYIIKTHNSADDWSENGTEQPYINEMLQTQAISTDLKDILAKNNFAFQTFMFASAFVSCTEFVEGEHPEQSELYHRLNQNGILETIKNYILEKRNEDPLWEYIDHDFYALGAKNVRYKGTKYFPRPKSSNFIKTRNGVLVFIDPFSLRDFDTVANAADNLNAQQQVY